MRAAQAMAGNAAISDALEPEEDDSPVTPASAAELPGLRLRRPGFEIAMSPRAFDPLLEGSKARSARTLAGAMAGKRGRISTDWVAATGDARSQQTAEVRAGRRRTVVRGQLEDLAALQWEQGDLSSTASPERIDLRRIAPATQQVPGRLRVRVGPLDLIHQRADVEVRLDGRGSVQLSYELPRGRLLLTGQELGRGTGGLDWEYVLEVPTPVVARAVWSLRPAERGGLRRASAEAPPDDDGDDDDPKDREPSRESARGGGSQR